MDIIFHMELRHLKYFVAVAEELHFGRAAQRLGIAQPPLSQQIKALEAEIGAALLHRTNRRVGLTAAGTAFLAEARKVLDQSQHAVRAAQRAARGEIGQLAVGFVSSVAYGIFPEILQEVRRRFPDLSLTLQDMTSEEQVEAMRRDQLDVGLVRPPVADAGGLSVRVIWREPLMAAVPETHRLARRREIPLGAMAGEPFVLVPRRLGPGFYDEIIRLCASAGFTPKVVQEARAMQTIISLVAGGMGVSLVPASLRNLQRTGVVYRPLKAPTTDLAAMWREHDDSPALRAFLESVWQVTGAAPALNGAPSR